MLPQLPSMSKKKQMDRSRTPRHAKSALSTKNGPRNSIENAEPESISPARARRDAVLAGKRAYKPGREAGCSPALPKAKYSVRFVGPKSTSPLVSRSITRRQAEGVGIESPPSRPQADFLSTKPFAATATLLTALPQIPPRSPSLNRKRLCKAKSSLSANTQYSFHSQGHGSECSYRAVSPASVDSRSPAVIFYSSHSPRFLPLREEPNHDHTHQEPPSRQPSIQSFVAACKREFSLKKTVRPVSVAKSLRNSQKSSVASVNIMPKKPFRKRLSSFKKGVQNVLHLRTPSRALRQNIPAQHVSSSREHFLRASEEGTETRPSLTPEDDIELSAVDPGIRAGRSSSQEQVETGYGVAARQGHVAQQSARQPSQGTAATQGTYGSRVTSWADSSVAGNTGNTGSLTTEEKIAQEQARQARLSVIQEYGSPYQPSQQRVQRSQYGAFQQPLPELPEAANIPGIDRDRVYSALQRHMEAHSAVGRGAQRRGSEPTLASSPSEREASIRVISGGSRVTRQVHAAAGSTHSLQGQLSLASEWTDDGARVSPQVSGPGTPPPGRRVPHFSTPTRTSPRDARTAFPRGLSSARVGPHADALAAAAAASFETGGQRFGSGFVGFGSEVEGGQGAFDSPSVYSPATVETSVGPQFGATVEVGGYHQVERQAESQRDAQFESGMRDLRGMSHWLGPSEEQQRQASAASTYGTDITPPIPPRSRHRREREVAASDELASGFFEPAGRRRGQPTTTASQESRGMGRATPPEASGRRRRELAAQASEEALRGYRAAQTSEEVLRGNRDEERSRGSVAPDLTGRRRATGRDQGVDEAVESGNQQHSDRSHVYPHIGRQTPRQASHSSLRGILAASTPRTSGDLPGVSRLFSAFGSGSVPRRSPPADDIEPLITGSPPSSIPAHDEPAPAYDAAYNEPAPAYDEAAQEDNYGTTVDELVRMFPQPLRTHDNRMDPVGLRPPSRRYGNSYLPLDGDESPSPTPVPLEDTRTLLPSGSPSRSTWRFAPAAPRNSPVRDRHSPDRHSPERLRRLAQAHADGLATAFGSRQRIRNYRAPGEDQGIESLNLGAPTLPRSFTRESSSARSYTRDDSENRPVQPRAPARPYENMTNPYGTYPRQPDLVDGNDENENDDEQGGQGDGDHLGNSH